MAIRFEIDSLRDSTRLNRDCLINFYFIEKNVKLVVHCARRICLKKWNQWFLSGNCNSAVSLLFHPFELWHAVACHKLLMRFESATCRSFLCVCVSVCMVCKHLLHQSKFTFEHMKAVSGDWSVYPPTGLSCLQQIFTEAVSLRTQIIILVWNVCRGLAWGRVDPCQIGLCPFPLKQNENCVFRGRGWPTRATKSHPINDRMTEVHRWVLSFETFEPHGWLGNDVTFICKGWINSRKPDLFIRG